MSRKLVVLFCLCLVSAAAVSGSPKSATVTPPYRVLVVIGDQWKDPEQLHHQYAYGGPGTL